MSDCCNINMAEAGRHEHDADAHACPVNGKKYARVHRKTLLHHILHPWLHTIVDQQYYFCTDPECDVVYYGQDDTVIRTGELRTPVWQKSNDVDDEICYCFGVSRTQALLDNNIRKFVTAQTKSSLCSCETSNPSGRCCLKDFPGETPRKEP